MESSSVFRFSSTSLCNNIGIEIVADMLDLISQSINDRTGSNGRTFFYSNGFKSHLNSTKFITLFIHFTVAE